MKYLGKVPVKFHVNPSCSVLVIEELTDGNPDREKDKHAQSYIN